MSAYASFLRDNAKGRPTVGEFLQTHTPPQSVMAVVSAYFSVYAYDALQPQLDGLTGLRFLFGEPNFVLDQNKERKVFHLTGNGAGEPLLDIGHA